jgi:ElaB/YqjD/DUF883 family membrane-anchored ribosome-binding protein
MPKAKSKYTEIDDIREDLNSLKSNVVELTRHLRKDTSAQSEEFKSMALERLLGLKDAGRDQYKNIEKRVKAKPSQSLAYAFGAGLVVSFLLSRR